MNILFPQIMICRVWSVSVATGVVYIVDLPKPITKDEARESLLRWNRSRVFQYFLDRKEVDECALTPDLPGLDIKTEVY
jgi:hypothetical protein